MPKCFHRTGSQVTSARRWKSLWIHLGNELWHLVSHWACTPVSWVKIMCVWPFTQPWPLSLFKNSPVRCTMSSAEVIWYWPGWLYWCIISLCPCLMPKGSCASGSDVKSLKKRVRGGHENTLKTEVTRPLIAWWERKKPL